MDPSSESLRSGPGPHPHPGPGPGPGLGYPSVAPPAAACESKSGTGTASLPRDGSMTKHTPIVAADNIITASHLARFEFSELGTKILMVEWYPGAATLPTPADDLDPRPCAPSRNPTSAGLTATSPADNKTSSTLSPSSICPSTARGVSAGAAAETSEWNISWPGKSTYLPARETDEDGARRRVYFMLPNDVPVPGTVTVSRPGHQTLVLKPLPAIFPERLETMTTTTAHGPLGVLHTLWAKRRLVELDREMESEMRTNVESVGLEMALSERQWIVENFLPAPPAGSSPCHGSAQAPHEPRRTASTTLKSHAPGRLGDKLKALRLATSPVGLAPSSMANTFTDNGLPSTPPSSDIAVSSFSAISRSNPVAAAAPSSNAAMSLDSILHDGPISGQVAPQEEDDLFALPMSPRSPDMIKSPFSVLGARPF